MTEILVHWHAGRSLSEASASLEVDRKTIRKYIARRWRPASPRARPSGKELAREWFPELSDARLRQVTWPAIAEHHEYITEQALAAALPARRPRAQRHPRPRRRPVPRR